MAKKTVDPEKMPQICTLFVNMSKHFENEAVNLAQRW